MQCISVHAYAYAKKICWGCIFTETQIIPQMLLPFLAGAEPLWQWLLAFQRAEGYPFNICSDFSAP